MIHRRHKKGTSDTPAEEVAIVHGSGNVFEDLGLPEPELWLAKADLTRVIEGIIKEREWTQRKAASVLGIATSDMSDLIRGKLKRFSLERLERFLIALDMDVRIQIAPRRARSKCAKLSVQLLASL
jgi:predicted XRE-type DNA-binding protein